VAERLLVLFQLLLQEKNFFCQTKPFNPAVKRQFGRNDGMPAPLACRFRG
jgi:hypothetical protein